MLSFTNPSMVCNLIALALAAGLMIFSRGGRKNGTLTGRVFSAMLWDTLAVIVLGGLETVAKLVEDPIPNELAIAAHSLLVLTVTAFFGLLVCYLLCKDGREAYVRKRRKILFLPLACTGMMLILNIGTGWFFNRSSPLVYLTQGDVYLLLFLPLIPWYGMIIHLLWRTRRVLLAVLLALTGMRLYFEFILGNISLTPLALTLALVMTYLLLARRSLLFEVGCVLTLLFLMMILLFGNLVTTSSFSSSLKAEKEVNGKAVRQIVKILDEYPALAWLLDYWEIHPELVTPGYVEALYANETEYQALTGRLDGQYIGLLTREEVEALTPEEQQAFANICYSTLKAEFRFLKREYDLNTLFLISIDPEGSDPVQLMSGDEPFGGSYLLAARVRLRNLEKTWQNFEAASSQSSFQNWIWLRYSPTDLFGFYEEIHPEGANRIYRVCNTILASEIYEDLSFASVFRSQAILLSILIAVIILVMLYLLILQPLRQVDKSVAGYQESKDAEKVQREVSAIRSRNEIGVFAHHFADLTVDMDRYTHQLVEMAENQERLAGEMRLAATIQRNALSVDFPDDPAFTLFACMTPARDVGGDFYDFFRIDEDHLALVIADVSGKGIPAALFMMSVRTIINDRAMMGGTPAEILTAVNDQLRKRNSKNSLFVTVWLGILDLRTGRMVCANAGHEYPFLRDGGEGFRMIEDPHGLVIGGLKGIRYENYEMQLPPGGAVFVYTDGIPEAADAWENFYGMERLQETMKKIPPEKSPEEILDIVQESVKAFTKGAEQFDDLTMLCLVYH